MLYIYIKFHNIIENKTENATSTNFLFIKFGKN